jgi:hypothetical protein
MTLRYNMKFRQIFITVVLIAIIAISLLLILNPMNDIDINSLEKRIKITDYIAIFAIVLTLAASILSFTYKGKLNVLLNIETEKRELKIANAVENAETAKKDAALAEEKSSEAIRDAAEAHKKAAEIRERAANAELKSKELEIELIKLKLEVGDRFLPNEIQDALGADLAAYSPKRVTIYLNVGNDSEPKKFALNLKEFFTKVGWSAQIIDQHNVMIPPPTGMQIIGKEAYIPILKIFDKYLKTMNYEYKLSYDNSIKEDFRVVIFSHK